MKKFIFTLAIILSTLLGNFSSVFATDYGDFITAGGSFNGWYESNSGYISSSWDIRGWAVFMTNSGSTENIYKTSNSYNYAWIGYNPSYTRDGVTPHYLQIYRYANCAYTDWDSCINDGYVYTLTIYVDANEHMYLTPQSSAVSDPTFGTAGGTYYESQSVSLSTSTSGASIRYTTDGSTPTSSTGTVYSSAISVSVTTTIKAIAYKSGSTNSSVVSATYTIPILGCTDPDAYNYDEDATEDDESCLYYGCTDPSAFNYDSDATTDDGSCVPVRYGCTDPDAWNFDPISNTEEDPSICDYSVNSLPHSFVCENPTDDILMVFRSTGEYVRSLSCSGVAVSLIIHGADTYTVAECDTTESDCDFEDFATLELDDGYIGSVEYTWADIPTGSCLGDDICYRDWLIMNMIIIFFLSLMSMGFFITFLRDKK